MALLSDSIESFIKELMEDDVRIELKRNELAQHFGCAPSQINYVLATRFSVDRGYIIESHRGGGGYVRIIKMKKDESTLLEALIKRIGVSIDMESAISIISFLNENEFITIREAALMRSAIDVSALALPVNAKDVLRASVLKSMCMQIFKNEESGDFAR